MPIAENGNRYNRSRHFVHEIREIYKGRHGNISSEFRKLQSWWWIFSFLLRQFEIPKKKMRFELSVVDAIVPEHHWRRETSYTPPEPLAEPQPSQPPLAESQIPSGIAPEVLIRHPMVAQPPIKGNLDYQARPFHSELCFDTTTFRFQPELADSFHLLHRYRLEHLLTPRDFFYPRVAMEFYQSMTTN
ncbi:hypothetical protein VitviT2T_030451 [Vitis vinifera]|uniref:Uncharacterized protein n=1 Tax=Vitis vinifera TaxID=29760 RepID=A0ABY9E2E4_VITVI|nr:hypothetical protein VitviT2T_030451 [Vitis vinifera]